MSGIQESEFTEGPVAETIESQTAKLPSDVFLWSAVGAMAVSLGLRLARQRDAATFFGTWVPTILVFGLYNKIVKVAGHDMTS